MREIHAVAYAFHENNKLSLEPQNNIASTVKSLI